MLILVAHSKGGVGKSTIAVNLAAMLALARKDVLLLDADKQGSAAAWCALREDRELEPRISCLQRFGRLHKELPDLEERYTNVVVDAGGRDSEEIRSALLVTDVVVIPLLPSQFDLWSADEMAEMVDKGKIYNEPMRAIAVINRAPTHPFVREAEEARAYLSDLAIGLADTIIRDRRAFRRSIAEGRAVAELPDHKAIREIQSLYQEVIP